jgi:hypothetical protein
MISIICEYSFADNTNLMLANYFKKFCKKLNSLYMNVHFSFLNIKNTKSFIAFRDHKTNIYIIKYNNVPTPYTIISDLNWVLEEKRCWCFSGSSSFKYEDVLDSDYEDYDDSKDDEKCHYYLYN